GRRVNEPVEITKRKPLTKRQRVKLFDSHKGICCLCKLKIRVGEPWIDEHIIPREISGDDSLDNRAPAHVLCAKIKTKKDQGDIAKTYRVRAKHLGIRSSRSPMAAGRRSKLKRKMDGTVVDRETGEVIRRA